MKNLILTLLLLVGFLLGKAQTPDVPGNLEVQVGINLLNDAPSAMDLNIWGSKNVNLYYHAQLQLGESHFTFNPGIGLGLEKYRFESNVTLGREDGDVVIVDLNDGFTGQVKKTKLAANYIDIPLELQYHVNKEDLKKSFRISVGGKFGFLFNAHTKLKFKEDGDNRITKEHDNFDLSRFRYGLQGKLGIGGFNAYYYYSLSELFRNNKGPEGTGTSSMQVGLSFNAF